MLQVGRSFLAIVLQKKVSADHPLHITNATPELIIVHIHNARTKANLATTYIQKSRYVDLTLPEPIPLITQVVVQTALGKEIPCKKKSSSLFHLQNSDELIINPDISKHNSQVQFSHIKKQ